MRENWRLRRGTMSVDCVTPRHDPTVQARGEGGGEVCGEWRVVALVSGEEEGPTSISDVELQRGARVWQSASFPMAGAVCGGR